MTAHNTKYATFALRVLLDEPTAGLRALLTSASSTHARAESALPNVVRDLQILARQLLPRKDVPQLFGQLYDEVTPVKRADAALGLYLLSSDTAMPAKAEPNASFALRTLCTALAEQKPSAAFDFVARRTGIFMGIPVLAQMANGVATRAAFTMKSPQRRELLNKVRADLGFFK